MVRKYRKKLSINGFERVENTSQFNEDSIKKRNNKTIKRNTLFA